MVDDVEAAALRVASDRALTSHHHGPYTLAAERAVKAFHDGTSNAQLHSLITAAAEADVMRSET